MLAVKVLVACWLVLLTLGPQLAGAASDRKSLQLVARIQPRASLSLNPSQITFVGSEDQPLITTLEGPVQVTVNVRASTSRPATLHMRAESDGESTGGGLPLQQVKWTAAGGEEKTGVLSQAQEQLVGRWAASGVHKTELQFVLKNDGRLLPGEYQTLVSFTLTSP